MYDSLVHDNVIFRQRCEGVGVITRKVADEYAITGPSLRALGEPYDVRRAEPYGGTPRTTRGGPTSCSKAPRPPARARWHRRWHAD